MPLITNVQPYQTRIFINVAAAVAAAVRGCISEIPHHVYVLLMLINLVMIAVLHVKKIKGIYDRSIKKRTRDGGLKREKVNLLIITS